jgi:3-oxoacyl-[acyl-carrier-protein] synthase-3
MTTTRGGIVTGWGIGVPDKVVTNDDLSARMDTNDAWIRERTGIRERRIGGTTSQLAIEAGLAALERAGRRPDELTAAHGLLAIGAERLLVIGSETLSRITDWDDRSVAILVGDGAGAVVLEAVDGPGQLLSWNLGADGSLRHLLKCDHGGYLYMNGKEIFRKAVKVVIDSAQKAITDAGLTADDIDLMVPHQANLRIISAACQRLGIPEEKAVVVIDHYGNTSSASIPLALADALDTGRLNKGDNVLLTGFGGGMTWASAVLHWGG